VRGYAEEEGVRPGSRTETFVALKLGIMNWRWQGVPFYLRTGKRMRRRFTRVAVYFRGAPVSMFEHAGSCVALPNVLLLDLQPNEGFSLHIGVKDPGSMTDLRRVPLSFKYSDVFEPMADAYETLLVDVLRGDQTLFLHSDEVLESWRLYDPLLKQGHEVHSYPAGSFGPSEADHFGIPERELFQTL
jgi:glucose-6-phosphate 1-dehydrogenase